MIACNPLGKEADIERNFGKEGTRVGRKVGCEGEWIMVLGGWDGGSARYGGFLRSKGGARLPTLTAVRSFQGTGSNL